MLKLLIFFFLIINHTAQVDVGNRQLDFFVKNDFITANRSETIKLKLSLTNKTEKTLTLMGINSSGQCC